MLPRARLARALARAAGGREGSVTMQVLVMSLLLFGSTGLVLDAGRAFATHSQMQAFADQVALAAASELDRKPDSIARARAAVYGLEGQAPFLQGFDGSGARFEVSLLVFLADMPPDTQSIFSAEAFVLTDETAQSTDARYAAAYVAERRVPSLLGAMASISASLVGHSGEALFEPEIRIDALAVATLEIATCADLSTLVLCNPWEGQDDSPVADADGVPPGGAGDLEPIPGRSLQYFAPNYTGLPASGDLPPAIVEDGRDHGSIYPYSVRNQLFLLSSPVSDPGGACSALTLLRLAGEDAADEGGADYIEARDRCLLARARAERLCFGETIGVRPASGQTVARGVNVAFDIFNPPFEQLLNSAIGTTAMPGTGLTLAQFFEPDALVASPFEPLPVALDGGLWAPPPEDFLLNLHEGFPFPDQWALGDGVIEMGIDPCHIGTYSQFGPEATGTAGNPYAGRPRCAQDFVSDRTTADRDAMNDYYRAYYDLSPLDAVPDSVETWYDLYRFERAANLSGSTTLSLANADDNPANDGRPLKTDPTVYLDPDGANRTLLDSGHERRRIRSAMVNCQAASEGATQTDGTYPARIAAILDVFLPLPATMYCGPGVPSCEVDEQIESRLFVELIEDVTDRALLQRHTAQLVR